MGIFPFKPARKAGFFPKCVEETKKRRWGCHGKPGMMAKRASVKLPVYLNFLKLKYNRKDQKNYKEKLYYSLQYQGNRVKQNETK
jgi:hypothetical protein